MSVVLRYQDEGEEEIFHFDVTVRELHNWSAEATKHPVELDDENTTTRKITDHVVTNGVTLQLTGRISDDPITIESAIIGNAAGLVGGAIGGGLGAITTAVLAKSVGDDRAGAVKPSEFIYEQLDEIYKEGIIVSITTGIKMYFNMVMEDLTLERTAQNGGGLDISATFYQMQTVESETADIPEAAQDTPVAGANQDRGKKTADSAQTTSAQQEGFVLKFVKTLKSIL